MKTPIKRSPLTKEHRQLLSKALMFRYKKTKINYASYHKRVYRKRGKATKCEKCGTLIAKQYEWANVSGHYEDVNDYIQLCVSCHVKFDHKGIWNFHKLKPKQCLSCGKMFNPKSRSQLRCGNRYTKGSCSRKHFNEYHRKRMYEEYRKKL